jgi:hypothetical protein
MNIYMGECTYSSTILHLVLDGGQWSASRTCSLTPIKTVPGTHFTGVCMGSRVGLEFMETRKYYFCPESNPGRPARRYTD